MFESVECLIKNDFRKFNDLQAVLTELNHAANVLNELFHLPRGLEFGPQGLETGGYSIYTDSDCDIYRIYLKDGYWHMVSGYVYSALFESDLKLRQNFVKAAKALGQQEAWYCDNYHLEDCSAQKWNYDVQTFEEWLEYSFLRRQVRWSGIPISLRIFQLVVIHTVKGFGIAVPSWRPTRCDKSSGNACLAWSSRPGSRLHPSGFLRG